MRYYFHTLLVIFFYTFLAIGTTASLAQVTGVRDILKDPVISSRCKALIKERNKKIQVKQKLFSLIKRNEKLLKLAPRNKESAIMKLEVNASKLQNKLRLTKFSIQSMEENIVRQGCPGMTL
jgi:Tfp pilus assembly protein PilO